MWSFFSIFILLILNGTLAMENYRLVLERVEFTNYVSDLATYDFKVFKLNRTVNALNVSGTIFHDITYSPNDIIDVQTYEFLNNQYKPFAVHIKRVFCDYLEMEYNLLFSKDMPHFMPRKCPVKKGFYYISNYIPPASRFVKMPFNRMKFEQKFYRSGVLHYKTEVFVLFDRDVVYREQYN